MNLVELLERFTKDEVLQVIKSQPPDKVPGPNEFTSCFVQSAWEIIHPDIMSAFDTLWHLNIIDLHLINDTLMVLLSKSNEATMVCDYKPISLIHVLGKLLSKVLSKRLLARIGELVHPTQSMFIEGRLI
jgi:hypothetical protein